MDPRWRLPNDGQRTSTTPSETSMDDIAKVDRSWKMSLDYMDVLYENLDEFKSFFFNCFMGLIIILYI